MNSLKDAREPINVRVIRELRQHDPRALILDLSIVNHHHLARCPVHICGPPNLTLCAAVHPGVTLNTRYVRVSSYSHEA
jgi:hypothetical protein